MSVKRKTPPALAEVIMNRQPETIAWIEEKIRVKGLPVDQQAEHIQRQTLGEMAAFMDGYNACLEEVMHRFNCYAGFHHYGEPTVTPQSSPGTVPGTVRYQVSESHPQYRPWRKLYYTNGIAKK